LYVAHVGDSRIYRLRRGVLRQMTADHTMRDLGVAGEAGTHLSRAVGVWPQVQIDLLLGKPLPDDVYCLCSDGLSKMVSDDDLASVLGSQPPQIAVERLIDAANANGGKDNVTVIIVRVECPRSRAA
jgi:protein phosphatase